MEKIYTFIDGQNLYKSVQGQGWKIDYRKLYIYLQEKFHAAKIFYFIGYIESNKQLYKKLRHFGYTIIFKPTVMQDGVIKGNVDGELILHAMIEYQNYSKAIIVSGDGDFYCLASYLQDQGKLERIIIPDKNRYSKLLRKFGKRITYLNDQKEKLKRKET